MNSEAAAYLAGLIEGEGWFGESRTTKRGKVYTYHRMVVKMTDLDVLQAAQVMSGLGYITGPFQRPDPNHKQYWHWTIGSRKQLKELVDAIGPWLGTRRTARLFELGLHTQEAT